jgi:mRNA interferase RelE/StbE
VKQIIYTKGAARALVKMPSNTAIRIRKKIIEYAIDPASQANNIKTLQGSGAIRLRVGNWRIIMEDGVVLEVQAIGPGGGIYE